MNFYNVEAEFYDLFYFKDTRDIGIYRKYLCSKILDIMTGTGRILYHLKPEYGVGIDSNKKMLRRARENLKDLNVKLVEADARNFSIDECFCLVIIGYNSLMMFSHTDRIKILKNAARHLSDDGILIVDVLNPFALVDGIVHHGDTVERDGIFYSRFFVPRWVDDHWKITYMYDVVKDGLVSRKYAWMDLYPVDFKTLKEEVSQAGLCISEVYGDYDFTPFDEDSSDRIIAVIKKCGKRQ